MAQDHDQASHGGRPTSWIAVGVMIAGFAIGGAGLMTGPSWPTFWIGLAVVAAGGVFGLAVGILGDVVVDAPRVIPELTDKSAFGSEGPGLRGGSHGETIDKPTRTDPQELPHG
jgi:hypothetical protein